MVDSLFVPNTPDSPILVARAICANRSGRAVLQGLSIDIRAGERLYIHGENGSGKTTLLETLLGIHPRESGYLEWLGRPASPASQRAFLTGTVFYLPQYNNLFPSLTLRENVLVGKNAVHQAGSDYLEAVLSRLPPLKEAWNRRPFEASAGQRQLAACARAMLQRPRLLVLDEPTAGVSIQYLDAIYDLFAIVTAAQGCVVFTEQHLDHARRWATRSLQLYDGHFVAPTDDINDRNPHA